MPSCVSKLSVVRVYSVLEFQISEPDNEFRLCRSLKVVLQLRQREEHSVSSKEPKYTGPEGYIGLVVGHFSSSLNMAQVRFGRIWESNAQKT